MTTTHDNEVNELLQEVRRISVHSRSLASGVMSGGYTSVFRGAGIEFDSVREYVDGDDPRAVDWNVTARVGRPFVKKYVDERELTVVFLLDTSASMAGGFGVWSARQTAARVCACLGLSAVRNNDKVGLVTFGGEVGSYLPPRKGMGHVLRIVRECIAHAGAPGPTRLAPVLDFVGRVLRKRAIVFLVSDFMSGGWQDSLGRCARRHDVVAVRLLTPELAPPASGLMRVVDPETGRAALIDWNDAAVRTAYAAQVQRWRSDTDSSLRRAGVDLMDMPVPRVPDKDAIARPILSFFRMRELRGARG